LLFAVARDRYGRRVLGAGETLVGRDAELRTLERALGGGGPRAVGIVGEPGIGKSRLLGELGRRAADRGHVVLAGRASELERDVPFALWVDALDDHVAALGEALGDGLADLAIALPAVARSHGGAPAAAVERHRVARAVRGLLARLAATRPLTLLLDDVHWADPASADVVALLVHRPPEGPVLLALAARAGQAPALELGLATAARHRTAAVIEVGPLARGAADALMPGVGSTARARLFSESGGNPFYLEELLRAGAPGHGGHALPGTPGVPRAVMAALAGEIAAVGAEARLVAQSGAVVGDPFDPAIAAAVAGMGERAALAALDSLHAVELVRPTGHPRRFRFRHPLVRRAVYESGGAGWRLAAHARAAAALAARGATPAERAHHVERAAHAGDLDAVGLLAQAAEQTLSTAPATSAAWYAAALRLLPGDAGHDGRRLELLRARADALTSAGAATEARDALRRVIALLPAGAVDERAAVTVRLAQLEALWTQEPARARGLLEDQRDALRDVAPAAAAQLTLALATERNEYGDFAATRELTEQARAAARAAGDRPLEALAAAMSADAANCLLRGDDPAAVAAVDREIAAAGALIDGLPDAAVAIHLDMLLTLAITRMFSGDFRGADAAGRRGLALARATRQGLLTPAFVSVLGFVDQELGRLDSAEARLEEALDSAHLSGNVQVAYWASVESCVVALLRGRIEAALEHGQVAWDLLGTREYSQAGFVLADARLGAGDPEGARAALAAFGWVRPQLWTLDRVKAAEIAVRVMLALGRVEEAAAWADRVPLESGGRRDGIFGAYAGRARAAVLLATGAPDDAARAAAAGAAAADGAGAPIPAASCRTLEGEALAAAGHADAARERLRGAAAELDRIGAFGPRDAALKLLRRLGDRPRPRARVAAAGDPRLAPLTPREREVALEVAAGRTNAQIAHRLQLSERTVEKHVSNLLAKLGLSTRAEVVRLIAATTA
jgi:DNA-binding NarL/FixJ family response regulator